MKKLLLGVTGSAETLNIYNYVACLSQYYGEIRVILTQSAENFINIGALNSLCSSVYKSKVTSENMKEYNHIKLVDWADDFIILPASANCISKISYGIADDFLTTTSLAYGNRLYICPNMNKYLWDNLIIQDNVRRLKKYGYHFIGPVLSRSYELASQNFVEQYVVPSIEDILREVNVSE